MRNKNRSHIIHNYNDLVSFGVWRDGPETYPECNMPTLDAGKACSDSSQCESYCQAPKGVKIDTEATGQCY